MTCSACLAQQPVADENANSIAHLAGHQRRGHRRVDAAAEAADDPPLAHPGADFVHRLFDEGFHIHA